MNFNAKVFSGLAGYCIDLYRLLAFRTSNPHSYTKARNLLSVARGVGARQLIETGTLSGQTASRCAPHFDRVYTIELDPVLARKATQFLAQYPNVVVIEGAAEDKLPSVFGRDGVNDVLVYLDAHFSGPGTALGTTPEPACQELEMLVPFKDRIRAIVVDDFRCFGTEFASPTKSDLLASAERHFNQGFDISVHLDQLIIKRSRAC